MTRKKYDKDIEGEAIQAVYGQADDWCEESDEEEEEIDLDAVWDEIQDYVEGTIKYDSISSWVHKWFSANELIHQIEQIGEEEKYFDFWDCISTLRFYHEQNSDIDRLRDHMWNILESMRVEPMHWEINALTMRMLRQRTKYYYIGPKTNHLSIVSHRSNRWLRASI